MFVPLVTPLERLAAGEVRRILAPLAVGTPIADSVDLNAFLSTLERYLPEALERKYPNPWRSESLDGLYPSRALKIGPRAAEVTGMCILLSDQTLTPFHVSLSVGENSEEIEWLYCRLGERTEDGLLRIPYGSSRWKTRLHALDPSKVEWVYEVEFPEGSSAMKLSTARVEFPGILLLEERGYVLSVSRSQDGESWTARRGEIELEGRSPLDLIELASLAEAPRPS